MQTTAAIKLDVASYLCPPTVYAKQNDKGTRFVEATLLDNGAPYTIENGTTARIRILKPDNTMIYNNATISSGKVTAELTSQALAAYGMAIAEIGLFKGEQILSTFTFYIRIERSAVDDSAIESTDEFTVLEQAIRDAGTATTSATSAASAANSAAGVANNAASSANSAAGTANAAAQAANDAISAIYHDKNFLLTVNPDDSLTLTYNDEEE